MKITNIEILELRVPGWDASGYDGSWDDCVIRVHTDAGITGIAEVDSEPVVIRAIMEAPAAHTKSIGLRAVLIGQDPMDTTRLWDRMYDASYHFGRRGAAIHAISGIDMALWDIRGKAAGKPIAELLGGRKRDRVLAYGTVYPLGRNPDEVRVNLDRALAMGLKAIKIVADPFWNDDLEATGRIIRTARSHVGPDISLHVDAATAWTRAEDGLPLMPLFAECKVAWLEAPLPLDDVEGHARFSGQGVPVGGGDMGLTTRFEFFDILDRGRCDIAQPDLSMAGGYTELLRIAEGVKARGKRMVLHGYKTNLLIAANLQFIAQHWADEPAEYSTSKSPLRWELTNELFPIGPDGRIAVPTAPGIGVTLNEQSLIKFARRRS
ncbi:MAG: mandelate racemase/muconate lactonizing enzyme family protein [Alphaproteobacteria bacterium]|nr:mandelate racemase/muconate lactonizing enzyme family protein [Alphaproteobacteria bacterium]